jgi:hypothetical protein
MSDEFHRPTYTSADVNNGPTNDDGHYNPTQVRLYGIPGKPGLVIDGVTANTSQGMANITIDLNDPEKAKANIENAAKLLDMLRRDPTKPFSPATIGSGFPIPKFAATYQLGLHMKMAGLVYLGAQTKDKQLSAGIMFGYAYEGHTYDFPKPKIMLVPSFPLEGRAAANAPPTRPADDSGYDKKYPEGYCVWLVDKLDHCVEIEASQGFVEEIVLEANLPGKRSPTMYGAKMALAHRGGRLSE